VTVPLDSLIGRGAGWQTGLSWHAAGDGLKVV